MALNNIGLRHTAIGRRIVLARFGKDPQVALETRDAMNDFWQALVSYAFDGKMPEKGEAVVITFGGGDEQFSATISRTGGQP